MVNYYSILEVDEHASEEEIRRSYHRLALRYHPDKAGPEGATKFKEISTAYQVLSDPQKKAVYDKYGETGLDAMDNPIQTAVPLEAMNSVVMALLVLLLVSAIMLLIFLSFLGAYVDGHLSPSWNYVKVFSPLFVSDVLIGLPALVLMIAAPLLIRGSVGIVFSMGCLVILCSVLLTILIPICKDRNEKRVAAGRTDYLKWRVWLIPGYLLSLFAFVLVLFCAFPSSRKRQKCKAYGLMHFANFLPVSFVLRLLAVWCIPVFFALIACRADEVITTNYFVIIGVPVFVAAFCLIVDFTVGRVLLQVLTRGEEEEGDQNEHPNNNNNNNNNNADGSVNEREGRETNGGDGAANTQFSTPEDANEGDTQPNQTSSANKNNNTEKGKTTVIFATHSCCRMVVQILALLLLLGLFLASASMISVRLNYYYAHKTYTGVLSLGKALIPIYIIAGVLVLFLIIAVPLFCCMGAIAFDETQQGEKEDEKAEQEMHENENGAAGAHTSQPENAADEESHEPTETVILLQDKPAEEHHNAGGNKGETEVPVEEQKPKPQTENVDHID